MNDDARLHDQALEESPIPRIVANADGILASANARARELFSINIKDLGRPLKDLEICYRPAELRALIEQAYAERRPVILTRATAARRPGELHRRHADNAAPR